MQWSRKKVVVATSLIVLSASVIAGCSSSSSSDDTGANRTDPGVSLTPGIGHQRQQQREEISLR
jgi:hypothetical protein